MSSALTGQTLTQSPTTASILCELGETHTSESCSLKNYCGVDLTGLLWDKGASQM